MITPEPLLSPALRDLAAGFLAHGARAVLPRLADLSTCTAAELDALPMLPFGSADFSRRLLRQQLDESTNDSSRRADLVAHQLARVFAEPSVALPRAVHHPMCGPGRYAAALATLGVRRYRGVDAAPAVVHHARRNCRRLAGYDFAVGEATAEGSLPPAGVFDTVLLSYDAANFLPPARRTRFTAALADRLPAGGQIIFDLRLREDGPAGFLDGRSVTRRAGGSLFGERDHLLLQEGVSRDGGAVLGHRFLAVRLQPPHRVSVFHSILWVPSLSEFTADLDAVGLTVTWVAQPFAGLSDPDLQAHLVVAVKNERGAP
ncbi:hypothetical protein GCM10010124_06150 [Pilimelia terevasa]|uniref:Methyltransferase domain-containing protein n=1 Tax=Pilimelia terevasa TaxID=53372 RepID=A0A8J3BEY1_9ACTN|nr:class I SAM-dependent methyltransferase [Pilimelia terevasa]GGK16335.1 hypothetical protein GCM10010124_06150 [Pilimelia terevasa]